MRRGLLKVEQLHALARAVYYGQRGRISAREVYDQMNACSCLTLILACIVYWQAREISRLAATPDFPFDPDLLRHVSPIEWKNVILYGEQPPGGNDDDIRTAAGRRHSPPPQPPPTGATQPVAAAATSPAQTARAGTVAVTAHVPRSVRTQLKQIALDRDTTLAVMLAAAVTAVLARHGHPEIAAATPGRQGRPPGSKTRRGGPPQSRHSRSPAAVLYASGRCQGVFVPPRRIAITFLARGTPRAAVPSVTPG